jgi:hypothetical protein
VSDEVHVKEEVVEFNGDKVKFRCYLVNDALYVRGDHVGAPVASLSVHWNDGRVVVEATPVIPGKGD